MKTRPLHRATSSERGCRYHFSYRVAHTQTLVRPPYIVPSANVSHPEYFSICAPSFVEQAILVVWYRVVLVALVVALAFLCLFLVLLVVFPVIYLAALFTCRPPPASLLPLTHLVSLLVPNIHPCALPCLAFLSNPALPRLVDHLLNTLPGRPVVGRPSVICYSYLCCINNLELNSMVLHISVSSFSFRLSRWK